MTGKTPSYGLGHYEHHLLGELVLDTVHHRTGILRAVAPDLILNKIPATGYQPVKQKDRSEIETTPPVAWLSPERGGPEWTTPVSAVRRA